MKNKLKFTFTQFTRLVKTERNDATGTGFLFGVLGTALIFVSLMYFLDAKDNADFRKKSAASTVSWQKELDTMRFQFKDTSDALAKLRRVFEADMATVEKNFQTLDKDVIQLQKNKADLPNVWNGAKIND